MKGDTAGRGGEAGVMGVGIEKSGATEKGKVKNKQGREKGLCVCGGGVGGGMAEKGGKPKIRERERETEQATLTVSQHTHCHPWGGGCTMLVKKKGEWVGVHSW